MPTSGILLVAQQLVTTILFQLLRLMFITAQRIYWQLNGTARKQREARLPQNYERSAQVLDVVFAHKFCLVQITTVGNFICIHNRFENPQYIIDHDNITLMTINEHDAIFCEPEKKGMHLWRLQYGSFIHHAQMKYCRRLIIVPLITFHRMSETIGDPNAELTFLFNIPRCGSTLLTQIMEFTGCCVSVSVPMSPIIVAMKYRKSGDSSELRQLARDVIRWECRPYPTMQPQPLGYFVKLTSLTIPTLSVLRELLPSSRCLFMYRDVEKIAKSLYRTSLVVPTAYLLRQVGKMTPRVGQIMIDLMGLNGANFCIRLKGDLAFGVLLSAVTIASYLDVRRRGFDISAVRYEDLVARPLDMCRVILEFCHLPLSLAERAVNAFNVDSQENSPLCKSAIGCLSTPEMTAGTKMKLNELLEIFELPPLGEPNVIEGTLTCAE